MYHETGYPAYKDSKNGAPCYQNTSQYSDSGIGCLIEEKLQMTSDRKVTPTEGITTVIDEDAGVCEAYVDPSLESKMMFKFDVSFRSSRVFATYVTDFCGWATWTVLYDGKPRSLQHWQCSGSWYARRHWAGGKSIWNRIDSFVRCPLFQDANSYQICYLCPV